MPTIVVLTGYIDIFTQFQRTIAQFEPKNPRIVVTSRGVRNVMKELPNWTIIQGIEPFVFARNANLGIQAADRDDVILINDDIKFLHPGSVVGMAIAAYSSEKIGIVSPQITGCSGGNILQNRITKLTGDAVISKNRLAFSCVYIKRTLIDAIGLLDERFTGYGCEDDDYCLRAHRAGFDLAVTPRVHVQHEFKGKRASASFTRTPGMDKSAEKMRQVFEEKHGQETEF